MSLKTTQSKLCGRAANHTLKTPADLYLPPSQQYIAKSLSEHVDSFRPGFQIGMLSIVFSLWFEPDTSAAVYTEPIVSLVDHTDLSLSLNRIDSWG